jgi:DNA polymerase (family 10)
MSNSDIAEIIETTGKLLDLHGIEEMRSKTYLSSIFNLEREERELADLTESELISIRGIGKLMAKNILEIIETGTLKELTDLIEITPPGIFDIFKVKGLGVKKIKVLWKELGIDNVNELKIACLNGKIAATKGFGEKTQESILASLAFIEAQKGKMRMNHAKELSFEIFNELKKYYPEVYQVGQVIRACEIVDKIEFVIEKDGFGSIKLPTELFTQDLKNSSPVIWRGFYKEQNIPIEIEKTASRDLCKKIFIRNSSENHIKFKNDKGISLLEHINSEIFNSEEVIYQSFGFPYIIPEMREGKEEFEWITKNNNEDLVTWENLKGTLHNHSTYSDGSHSLIQMANFAEGLGLSYFGIADHSQTAQYASGLKPETVLKQHIEIDKINNENKDFTILKGIESDILPSGDLDYDTDLLKKFDYVVASVHSVLNMDEQKATARLLKAIENPYTHILGHLSGRLLLSRNGYPLDYKKIIDACAANNVSMELNASPYRLDIDWRWIPYCVSKGVKISINPDAHEMMGLLDMHYGIAVARKAGLIKNMTLNALEKPELLKIFKK